MGYMGIGMQSWITRMKPKKYFGGRSKPDGGGGENLSGIDMKNYYHYKSNNLERLLQKKYSPNYRKKLRKELKEENQKQAIYLWISVAVVIVIFVSLLFYLAKKFEWFR